MQPEASASRSDAVRVPQGVTWRRFPREMVLLNLTTGQYHGLNGSAADLFELLQRLGSVAEVAATYAERCRVPVDRVRADLDELCDSLRERGLLTDRT